MVAFVFPVLWLEVDLYFQSSKLDGVIWQVFAVIPNLDRPGLRSYIAFMLYYMYAI
jgi:hypothetical protein